MAISSLDSEFMQLWARLTIEQKQSLLSLIKTFVEPPGEPITPEQYNREIEEAEDEYQRGDYLSHEELKKQIQQW